MTSLPYIHIKSPNGNVLKFLIDTGASNSFINPDYIHSDDILKIEPLEIKAMFTSHTLNQKIILPAFDEFQQQDLELSFIIFKFHNYFDGLLGLDILDKIQANIDIPNKILITPQVKLKILSKPNFMSARYNIPSHSQQVTKLPVDIKSGDVYLPNIYIDNNFLIPEGIYKSSNFHIIVPVTNLSEFDKEFSVEQPLKVTLINNDFQTVDFNNHQLLTQEQIYETNYNIDDNQIENLVRL